MNDKRERVSVLNDESNESFEESYDRLILSGGACGKGLKSDSDM
ncbi:hypothetical protein [Staphylococcus epidermidis]|nr:hypothetical protein [Staphylococcus epidermidis]